MDHYLSTHASQKPDSIAVEDDSQRLTYKDLETEVNKLASALKGLRLNAEEPICILEEINSKLVIAQLAVIRAGLTCVPMGLSLPKLRLIDMLNDIRAKYVLSDRNNITDDTEFTLIPISGNSSPEYESDAQEDGQVNGVSQHDELHEYRSHILFTSGSSGKPKAVQIPERTVLHLVTNTPITPLRDSDRVSLINSPGFDISIFEVFSALVAGAAMIPVPRMVVADPFMFREFVTEKKLWIVFLTAALPSPLSGILAQMPFAVFGIFSVQKMFPVQLPHKKSLNQPGRQNICGTRTAQQKQRPILQFMKSTPKNFSTAPLHRYWQASWEHRVASCGRESECDFEAWTSR
jgi:acyl-coenzyme A synthetase/AMP-(fatty) acid ligase